MTQDTKIAVEVLNRLQTQGRIAEVRRARKGHKCHECGMPINPKEEYLCVYIAGAGLGSLKFPDRICINCATKEA